MPSAFSPSGADFSLMDGRRDLFISQIAHSALLHVDEEGTEAIAATAAVIARKAEVIYDEFIADRPFLFFVVDRTSGCVLFLGRVSDPTL